MTPSLLRRSAGVIATLALASGAAQAAQADYPTAERVLYVQECMVAHPGPNFEMIQKCSCVIDAMAQEISYDQYVEISTAAKAISIGGERGSYTREAPGVQDMAKRYRDLQGKAQKRCFIGPPR